MGFINLWSYCRFWWMRYFCFRSQWFQFGSKCNSLWFKNPVGISPVRVYIQFHENIYKIIFNRLLAAPIFHSFRIDFIVDFTPVFQFSLFHCCSNRPWHHTICPPICFTLFEIWLVASACLKRNKWVSFWYCSGGSSTTIQTPKLLVLTCL